jgi:hypothetical protein
MRETRETFKTEVSVKHIAIPPRTIQLVFNGRDYYFTEEEFVKTFDQLARLWEDIYYAKNRS